MYHSVTQFLKSSPNSQFRQPLFSKYFCSSSFISFTNLAIFLFLYFASPFRVSYLYDFLPSSSFTIVPLWSSAFSLSNSESGLEARLLWHIRPHQRQTVFPTLSTTAYLITQTVLSLPNQLP